MRRIIKKIIDERIAHLDRCNEIKGKGIKRTISMSKTMKIIANKKNRVENGIRAA